MRPYGVIFYVDRLDEGVDFYTALFGVKPAVVEDRGFAEFDLNGFHVTVHETPVSTPEKPVTGRPAPIFEWEADPDEHHKRLEASRFSTPPAPTDRNYGLRQLNVSDPFGNRLAIVRPIA